MTARALPSLAIMLLAGASAHADVAPGPFEPRFSRCVGGLQEGDAPRAQITDAPLGGHWSVSPPIDEFDTQSSFTGITDADGLPVDVEVVGFGSETFQVPVPADAAVGDVYTAIGENGFELMDLTVVEGAPVAVTAEIAGATLVRFRNQAECVCTNERSSEAEVRVTVTSGGPALLDVTLLFPNSPPEVAVFGRLVDDGDVIVGLRRAWLGAFDPDPRGRFELRDPQTLAVIDELEIDLNADSIPVDAAGLSSCGCGCQAIEPQSLWPLIGAAFAIALLLRRRRPLRN